MRQPATDLTKLDDRELFEECRRVNEKLVALPARHADRGWLTQVYAALTDEFDRRARAAWQQATR
jgi:hypothetical protein